jgi:hypothetical protein
MTTDNEAISRLRKTVSDILWNDWDPIGISSFSNARDEYDAYVIPICRLLAAGPDQAAIYHELVHLAQDIIGLDTVDADSTGKAARKLYLLTV